MFLCKCSRFYGIVCQVHNINLRATIEQWSSDYQPIIYFFGTESNVDPGSAAKSEMMIKLMVLIELMFSIRKPHKRNSHSSENPYTSTVAHMVF